jgi:hypothetical protein
MSSDLNLVDELELETQILMIQDLLRCGHSIEDISKGLRVNAKTINLVNESTQIIKSSNSIPLNRNRVISILKKQPNAKSHYLKKTLCPDAK